MKMVLISVIAALILSSFSYADAESAFVLLDTATIDQVYEVVSLIEGDGGRVRIVYPPSALIADGVSAAVEGSHLVERVHRSDFDALPLLKRGDPVAYHAALAWLDMTFRRERPRSPVEPLKIPLDDLRLRSDGHRDRVYCDQPGTGTAPNAGFCDGTEYMAGTVAVDVIMPESDGSIDPNTEDWTPEEEAEVVSKITICMDWWGARAVERSVPLTFYLRFHYRVPTGYEPVEERVPRLLRCVRGLLRGSLHPAQRHQGLTEHGLGLCSLGCRFHER
jgi:hypothetical protein